MRDHNTMSGAIAIIRLTQARAAQAVYWRALSLLEEALGVEIDTNTDLSATTVEELMTP